MMKKANYYFESIGDSFEFGKHQGELLCDVIAEDPSYIYFCINNIPNFRITESVLHDIKKLFPSFIITVAFKSHIGDIDFDYSNEEWDNENYDYASYGRYAGSYAQDEMGYSDDDIDTIFEGDPSAYWNID